MRLTLRQGRFLFMGVRRICRGRGNLGLALLCLITACVFGRASPRLNYVDNEETLSYRAVLLGNRHAVRCLFAF